MTTPLLSRTSGLLTAALRLVAAAALVGLLSSGVLAQDNDDDGVLPATGGSSEGQGTSPDGSGGDTNGSNQAATIESDVLVAGELQDELDPARATIELQSTQGGAELVSEAPADAATFVADPPAFAAGQTAVGHALQASGQLHLNDGLQARFVPATVAQKSVALLVLAHDGPTLAAEVSGKTQPELVIPLGGATAVDLQKFAAITAKFGDALPGYHATIVFVSVNVGEMHTAAVRAHTQGGPLEVVVH